MVVPRSAAKQSKAGTPSVAVNVAPPLCCQHNRRLTFLDDVRHSPHALSLYENALPATSLGRQRYELRSIEQLYRDRADCENSFDELKNRCGWTGFTSQEIKRSALMARNNALS